MNHRGDWMQTFSGRKVYVLDPKPDDVVIIDIAHALARICRFGGHVKCEHYSVAQHSVLVSKTCPPWYAMVGLLHDSAEAYLGDVIRPLKYSLPGYKELEARWEAVIDEKFGLEGRLANLPYVVKYADRRLLATERRDVMSDGPQHERWNLHEPPLEETIRPWDVVHSETAFLHRYRDLAEQFETGG